MENHNRGSLWLSFLLLSLFDCHVVILWLRIWCACFCLSRDRVSLLLSRNLARRECGSVWVLEWASFRPGSPLGPSGFNGTTEFATFPRLFAMTTPKSSTTYLATLQFLFRSRVHFALLDYVCGSITKARKRCYLNPWRLWLIAIF